MRLDELIDEARKAMTVDITVSDKRAAVEGITDNTEEVAAGYIFVCVLADILIVWKARNNGTP